MHWFYENKDIYNNFVIKQEILKNIIEHYTKILRMKMFPENQNFDSFKFRIIRIL